MSRQTSKLIEKETVTTKNGKNMTIQPRQRKFMLRQSFSAGCQHQEEFVATKKLLSSQMKQEESRNSVATRDLLSQHILLQHEKAG